jgi:hypothetical protein
MGEVGQVARVITRIGGGSVPGEVVTLDPNSREVYIAYAVVPIEVQQRVLIINVRGPRMVDVEAWDLEWG